MSLDAYWVSSSGKVYDVGVSHIDEIFKKPERFKMDRKYLEEIYKKFNEPIGMEGKAREEIMIEAMKRGWIRVRTDMRSQDLILQVWRLDERTKLAILDFVLEMLTNKSFSKQTEMIILELSRNNRESTSVDDFLHSGSFFSSKDRNNKKIAAKLDMIKEYVYLRE